MLHVDDDMDNLFRKAAEEYPLNTGGADFERVASKLPPESSEPKAIPVKENTNRKYLLLLLLLPLGWISNDLYRSLPRAGVVRNKAISQPQSQVSSPGETKQADAEKAVATNRSIRIPQAESSASSSSTEYHQSQGTTASTGKTRKTSYASKLTAKNDLVKIDAAGDNNEGSPATPNGFLAGSSKSKRSVPLSSSSAESQPQDLNVLSKETAGNELDEEIKANKITKEAAVEKVADTTSLANNKTITTPKKQTTKARKFYVGVIGGLDVSTVKYQQVKDHGFNAGILLGYQIKKRWSAEVLVMFDKKAYYTDAKYFDNSKAYLPYFTALKNLEGNCKMIEVALNGKYNFTTSDKKRWFATAGLSSYFMSSENYDYNYVYPNGTPYGRTATYNTHSNYWFSVVNLGLGYEHTIARKTMLRVEPYIKLPLAGVGIGKLPISSSGVNFAITRKL
jgi:hypothetical protein